MAEHLAQEAPYRMLTHGVMTVSSTALAVPNLSYAGTNYNPTTAASAVAFTELSQKRSFVRIKNTHATDAIKYGKDASLTAANGFSLDAGGILQENIGTGDALWVIRGGSNDISLEFAEFGYI